MLLLLFDAIFGFNINKKSTPTFEQLKSLIKQENWSLINTVTFLSILLSSFDSHEKNFCGQICYIIINFFAQFQWNLLKTFEIIAYTSNWAFFGCSQSCLFFEHVLMGKTMLSWSNNNSIKANSDALSPFIWQCLP